MLKKFRIENFKLWKDTGDIRMAPITLFFGSNSSGKSSIGQFLLMLKQTVELSDRKAVFNPGGKNSAVQLGSYQEMVLHREPSNRVIFSYQWSLRDPLQIKDPVSDTVFSGDSLSFNGKVGLGHKGQHNLVVDFLKYALFAKDKTKLSIGMERKSETESEYKVESESYPLKRK